MLAILLPGLGKARRFARRTGCAANLRQIDVAMHMYLGANDDIYPCAADPLPKTNPTDPNVWLWMGRGWRNFIAPFLGGKIDADNPSVFLCPVDLASKEKYDSTSYAYSMAFYHSSAQIDGMNSTEDTYKNPQPPVVQKCVNVAKPSAKIIIGEWFSNHQKIEQGSDSGWWTWEGQRNYLFADGQVRFIKAEEIRPANDGLPNPNLTKHGIEGIDWP